MTEHLHHTTPCANYDPVDKEHQNRDLHNLDELNDFGRHIYLQSNDDPEQYPDWIGSEWNIPQERRSSAPAILIVVDKGTYVDAFWFFFYSFNLGNAVLGVRFGNHVGDWEHTAVRFQNGEPIEAFFSEHEWGAAYHWKDVEKRDGRPLTYSAYGTHAMYRTAGVHNYIAPFGLLKDVTDQGPVWDPTLNLYSYTWDYKNDIIRAGDYSPDAPEEWFHYWGKWGDKAYPMDDKRQYRFAGELHYVSGPTGPKSKHLDRRRICQGSDDDECKIREDVAEDYLPRIWNSTGHEEELEVRDQRHG